MPLNDEEQRQSINDLFKQLNEIIKRDVEKSINNETDIKVGDKFSDKDKNSEAQITIQTFSFAANEFPVIFKPNDVNFTDDKEITPIKGDFDDSISIFKIENDDSEETTEAPEKASTLKSSTDKNESTATTIDNLSTAVTSIDNSTKSSTALKDEKLVEEATKLPILTTGV